MDTHDSEAYSNVYSSLCYLIPAAIALLTRRVVDTIAIITTFAASVQFHYPKSHHNHIDIMVDYFTAVMTLHIATLELFKIKPTVMGIYSVATIEIVILAMIEMDDWFEVQHPIGIACSIIMVCFHIRRKPVWRKIQPVVILIAIGAWLILEYNPGSYSHSWWHASTALCLTIIYTPWDQLKSCCIGDPNHTDDPSFYSHGSSSSSEHQSTHAVSCCVVRSRFP